jgi:subtilisin
VVDGDVTVENVGTEDIASAYTVTLEDETDGATIGSETVSGGLTAGSAVTVTFSWDTDGASIGDHTLTGSHDLEDEDGANDSASTAVEVTEESTGDTSPTIDVFETSTRVTGPWQRVDVDWAVSDEDGDLASVKSELLDSGGGVLDSQESSVSGSSASGEHSLRTRSGDPVSVRLTVTDEAGNEATDEKTVNF